MEGNDRPELRGKVYSQTGTLLAYQGMYREALGLYKKSFAFNESSRDSISLSYNLRDIGTMYMELDMPDSALTYFKEAGRMAFQSRREALYRMMQSQVAAGYIKLGEYDSARVALRDALQDVEIPDKSGIYSIAASYYLSVGKNDSADWYYKELLGMGTPYAKRRAYRHFLLRASHEGDMRSVRQNLDGYLLYNDSIHRLTRTENLRRLYRFYTFQLKENEIFRLRMQSSQMALWLVAVALSLAVCVLALLLYLRCSRRKRKELEAQMARYRQFMAESQEEAERVSTLLHQQEELSKRLRLALLKGDSAEVEESNHKLEYLGHLLERQPVETKEVKSERKSLFESEIYRRLLARANSADGKAFVRPDEWEQLNGLLSAAYPGFLDRLASLHVLNENEIHVCILLKLRFRPADIARLLCLHRGSVSSIRSRLYEKLTGSKGTADQLDKIIRLL